MCVYVQNGHLSVVMQNGICKALLDVQHVSLTIISHNTVKTISLICKASNRRK